MQIGKFVQPLALLACCQLSMAGAQAAECRAVTGATRTPLINLYTSEGCSSCPPADRWLSTFVAENPEVAALSFHVDYWDYIGWKDRFADPRFSLRQRQRVQSVGRRTVYTPQVMLGSEVQLDWRDEDDVAAAIAGIRAMPAPAAIDIRAEAKGDHLDVVAGAALASGAALRRPQLLLVLYSNGLVSQVASGENTGKQMRHDRVARAVYGPWPMASGTALSIRQSLPLPSERGSSFGVMAIVEEAGSGEAMQVVDLSLGQVPGCAS